MYKQGCQRVSNYSNLKSLIQETDMEPPFDLGEIQIWIRIYAYRMY